VDAQSIVPGLVHVAPSRHDVAPHAPAPQVTSHAHELKQSTVPHAFIPVHVTLQATPEPHVMSSQALLPEHEIVHA
jgi:hypothetical protein